MNLFSQLSALIKIAPKEDLRSSLRGVYVSEQGLCATNGHILLTIDNPQNGTAIICREDLSRKLKLFNKNSDLKLLFNENSVTLTDSLGGSVDVLTLDVKYPNINAAILANFKTPNASKISVNLQYLELISKVVRSAGASDIADTEICGNGLIVKAGCATGYIMQIVK